MNIKKGDIVRILQTSQHDEIDGGIYVFDEYFVASVDCILENCVELYIINDELPSGVCWLFPIDWLEVVATND